MTRLLHCLALMTLAGSALTASAQNVVTLADPRPPQAPPDLTGYRTVKDAIRHSANLRRESWNTATIFHRPVYRLAVVTVEFPDAKHNVKITRKDWEKALFSTGTYQEKSVTGQRVYGSLNDYYQEQSCGAFRVEGKVFDYVQVQRERAEYTDRCALLTEVLDTLSARDGKDAFKEFDGIFFVYAGGRFALAPGGLYWPHRATLNYQGRRWAYFICPEGGEQMASISVVAHEFGHLLGLPDLYGSGSAGLGVWCTMALGHGERGRPLHLSAWCKEQMGWLRPAVIDPRVRQKLILSPVEGAATECFKVLLTADGSAYLLLENRAAKGFDREIPNERLLIWRVSGGRPLLEDRAAPITDIRRLKDGRITFQIGCE